MTETHTHTHSYENEHPHTENEAAPSAAKRTLGKHRFRFLYRERRGNVNWLALGFSAPWLVFLLMPLDSFLTTPELYRCAVGVALVALFAVVNCSAYAVPWLVPVASTVRRSVIWTLLMALPVATDGAAAGIGVYGVLVVQHVLCGVLDFWHNRPVPPALGCSGDDCPTAG